MKRTCNKCKANSGKGCLLKYMTERKKMWEPELKIWVYYKQAPMEECPKPITWGKLARTRAKDDWEENKKKEGGRENERR